MISALERILSRPKTVLTLMVVSLLAGIFTYITIPKEANPDVEVPVFFVSVTQQGVSPQDAVRLLVRPMETELRSLDGLKEITTFGAEGYAGAVLEFDIDLDRDTALADIRDKADRAKSDMPDDASDPIISEVKFSLVPTIYVALSGEVPQRTLLRHARQLQDEIEALSSVQEANLGGDREELLEVIIDNVKLQSYQVTQQELINAVTLNNQLVAAGFRDNGQGRFNVKVPGLLENAADVYSLPIKRNGDGMVTLADVADIRRTFVDQSQFTRVNGKPAITLGVVKRLGTNIIENNAEVRRVTEEFTKDWPEAIKVEYFLDQSKFIKEVQGSLESSIMTAIFLVMIVVMAALGLRSSLLVGLAIPTSFMLGFLVLGAMGATVNMMVMFGLVLTVGMLVDGAIVMTEYADRKISEGVGATEAYSRAAKLMFWPIVSSTATTLAAFLPLLLWPGVPGEFMAYLPIMVIVVLSTSLITALVFVPTMGVMMWRYAAGMSALVVGIMIAGLAYLTLGIFGITQALQSDPNAAVNVPGLALMGVAGLVLALLLRKPMRGAIERSRARQDQDSDSTARQLSGNQKLDVKKVRGFTGLYVRTLRLLIGNVFGNVLVIGGVLAFAVITFVSFGQNNAGVQFFVDEEPEQAVILVSGRGNFSGQEVLNLVKEVEDQVLQVPGIAAIVTSAQAASASGGGDPFGVQDKPADVIGELQIELADYLTRRKAEPIFAEIRERVAPIAGIKVEIRKIEGGPPTGKDITLQIKAPDYDVMIAAVARARAYFDQLEGVRDVEDGRPLPGIEWEIDIDREEAGRYDANIASVGAMLQLVTNGVLIGKYRPDDSDDEIEIRVRLPKQERTLDQFGELRLPTPAGLVPLSNFVDLNPQQKVSQITRRDGLYSMDVKASVKGEEGYIVADVANGIKEWFEAESWPEGVNLRLRGADEEQQESGAFLAQAMVGALFLMFLILLTQFNSFYQTILTLMTIILSVIGVLVGMLVTGQKFSIIMTGTGVLALAGIVVNNAIVLIDTYNRMRNEEGVETMDAILKTAAQRLRPILLTTGTTMLGLVPMALQINFDFFNQIINLIQAGTNFYNGI